MKNRSFIKEEVKGLYRIIPLVPFRRTPKVYFDFIPKDIFPNVSGYDRVIHEQGAVSPGPVGDVKYPWYMHPHQEDYLVVLHGTRVSELYTKENGTIEAFEVSRDLIKKNGKVIFEGPAILSWPRFVFHRVKSCEKQGSAALNFAVRYDGFDIKTNFSIYDLDIKSGKFHVIREGHLDQKL